jgi:tetratricopeptide (TPR) repeat protein
MIDYYQKAFGRALENVKQAARLFASVHDQQGKIYCLSLSAVILGEMGSYGEAAAQFDVALQACRQIGLRYAEARLLGQSGDNELNVGALASGYQRHAQALKIYQEIGDQEGIATSLDTMGLLRAFLARPAEAQSHYQEALALHRAIRDQRGEGYVLTHLGYLLIGQQAWQQAADVLEQALALRRTRAEGGLLLDTLAAYALVVATRDQAAAALPYVDEIMDWLASHGVAGIEFPGQVYLSCYRVLAHLAQAQPAYQPRALQTLAAGHAFLQERAQRIQDTTLRQSFLQNLPFHRDLMAHWQAQATPM